MTEPTATPTPNGNPAFVSWKDQKVKLIAQFPTLTDEDLRYDNGKKDEMLTRVQTKVGKTKEEFDAILAAL